MHTSIIITTLVTVLCWKHVSCYLVNDYTCDVNPYVNGCSIPGHLPFFYSNIFKPDCNKHDVCYKCGAKFGISRSECDHRLSTRIKHTCDTDSAVDSNTFCHVTTVEYYAAVRVGGALFYKSTAEDWCDASWKSVCCALFMPMVIVMLSKFNIPVIRKQ